MFQLPSSTNIDSYLETLPGDGAGSCGPVAGLGAVVPAHAVDLADGGDADRRSDVDVAGDGGATDEVPILVVGSQLLAHVGLDDVNPLGQLDLAGPAIISVV